MNTDIKTTKSNFKAITIPTEW